MRKNPKKIGKAIAQLKAKMSKTTPEERTKISNEISRLKALKLPGSVINIEDKIMLNYHPNKKGKNKRKARELTRAFASCEQVPAKRIYV